MNAPVRSGKKNSGYVINCELSCLILVPRKFIIIYYFKQQVIKKFRGGRDGGKGKN